MRPELLGTCRGRQRQQCLDEHITDNCTCAIGRFECGKSLRIHPGELCMPHVSDVRGPGAHWKRAQIYASIEK